MEKTTFRMVRHWKLSERKGTRLRTSGQVESSDEGWLALSSFDEAVAKHNQTSPIVNRQYVVRLSSFQTYRNIVWHHVE